MGTKTCTLPDLRSVDCQMKEWERGKRKEEWLAKNQDGLLFKFVEQLDFVADLELKENVLDVFLDS